MVDTTLTLLALVTGLVTGAVFKFLHVPIPAPPELPGVMGILGIYVGYKLVQRAGWGVDLLGALGA
jgi:XapX domain-containing protein